MPKKRVSLSALWAFMLMLMISTVAVAQVGDDTPKPVLNSWGMAAPFLLSWLPVWIFSAFGGIGAIFVKVGNIDTRFRYLYVAKPYLGVLGGMSLSIAMTDGRDPPEVILSTYAAISSFLSSAILQFVLVLMSSPKNSLKVVNSVSPVQFELPEKAEVNNDNI